MTAFGRSLPMTAEVGGHIERLLLVEAVTQHTAAGRGLAAMEWRPYLG